MGWDDGSWSKWTEPSMLGLYNKTYHVCHHCFSSPRTFWDDLFSLCQKSGVGTAHLPQSEQSPAVELEQLEIISRQHPEDVSGKEQYPKFKDPFQHSPLDHDQIRLLSLLPVQDGLCCAIEKVDLSSAAEQYEALSYCWGSNAQPKHAIWINGHPFEVTSNLYAALMQLRNPTSTRKLWIDAICINQVGHEGKAEKSIQIPLMGKIYHQATGVIVWLGAAEDDSDKIFDIITEQNVEAMQTREFATGFGRLLKRPWFRRTWIVQEFILAKKLPQILCGSRTVSYGNFMATHWVLPMLMDRFPDNEWTQLRKIVDSDGNTISSKLFKRKDIAVLRNHDEAEKTLAALITVRRQILDDECKLRLRPLHKILPSIKDFHATDIRDKIYGTFGVLIASVHHSVQVSYDKSAAEVYREAMTYMLRQREDEPGATDLYLEFPLSLSLDVPTPGLPSWVPDFSRNSPFLRVHEDMTWYWLYHLNSTQLDHKPLVQKQHGRHTVARSEISRKLIHVDDTRLTVRGLLVDEVDAVIESRFFGPGDGMREFSERQMKSLSNASQEEGRKIKSWLDLYDKTMDEKIPEITMEAGDPSMFFASNLTQRYRINNLYEINELCRKKFPISGVVPSSESWLTFIWRDLLEGHSALGNMSEEKFDEQFYDLAQVDKCITGEAWLSNLLKGEVRAVKESPRLNIPMRSLFQPPRTFFTTRTSGFYGIGPSGVQEGDKLAFLFPKAYMAFILRPSEEHFQMVGPCIVPPRLRGRALEGLHPPMYQGDEIVLI